MNNQESKNKPPNVAKEQTAADTNILVNKLSAASWALFFIWVGISFLFSFTIGVALLGVGIITLGTQLIRKSVNLKIEGFWFIIGVLFLIGGLGEIFEVDLPLVPIVLILAGLALLYSIFIKK